MGKCGCYNVFSVDFPIKLYNKTTNLRGVFRDLGPLLSFQNVKDTCGGVLYQKKFQAGSLQLY